MKMYRNHLSLFALTLICSVASAQTVTVTTSSNTVDIDFFTGTIADLPGPDGKVSFVEALIATDNTPGHQTIGFAIPQSEWILQFLYPGRAVLNHFLDFRATDSVTIDGTTQTAFTGDTNPGGNEIAIYSSHLYLSGSNSVLIGFDTCQVTMSGANALVSGNTGGLHIDASGANSVIENNESGTIKLSGASQSVIRGNTAQRIRLWGGTGIQVGGSTLAERNYITGYGTTNSEGLPSGTDIELFQTQGVLIENNYIGTTPDGMSQGNQFSNVGIEFADGNVGTVVKDNLIAGILGHGQAPHWAGTLWGYAILFNGGGSDIEIIGNTIGLDAAGSPTLPSVWGVSIGGGAFATYSNVRLGGYGSGEGNEIAGHYLNGVTIGNAIPNARIAGNSIYGNGTSTGSSSWLGIDLLGANQATGITPNDPLDVDSGGNGLQNFPDLQAVGQFGANLNIAGTLDSSPLSQFTLEFFGSPECSDTGFGEGQMPLGTATVMTDAAGHVEFDVSLAAQPPAAWFVTSTATLEPLGLTSEFSACSPIMDTTVGLPFCFGDGAGAACPCGNFGSSGHGCANSASTAGAQLFASGSPSLADDALTLRAEHSTPSQTGLFFQGDAQVAGGQGVVFGDGLRCVGGQVTRLQVAFANSSGLAESTISIATQGGAAAGQSLRYQWWYRDSVGSPCGNGFNLSSAVEVTWTP